MRHRLLLLFIISFFTFNVCVDASVCDNEHISQLRELAKQVDVSYEYIDASEDENDDGEFSINQYIVSVNLISDELYLSDGKNDYYYSNGLVNFITNAGNMKLYIYSTRCADIKLRTISLSLPKFNVYSLRDECKKLEEHDLDVCDPWYQGVISEKTFENIVSKYINDDMSNDSNFVDKIFEFLKSYYLYIIGGLILFCLIIFGVVVHRKRSVLE